MRVCRRSTGGCPAHCFSYWKIPKGGLSGNKGASAGVGVRLGRGERDTPKGEG